MKTNSGHEIKEGNGKYSPFDRRKEFHPDWMLYTLKQLDPFQEAVPCFDPFWQMPTAKEWKAFELASEQERREAIAIFKS